ncbi:MAG: heavy metal-binding domain-containing protein, partial [Myxococcales bacterium]|nr:heavy metal-binding domain-containing protein [Myxococcales bacterium]
MHISAMSGNEIYCLAQKGLSPGEIVVGNSVVSLGLAGGLGAAGRTFAGGEITQITSLISDGRHAAIQRMEAEAQRDGAIGVTGVRSKLGRLAGFTEFLAQGTGVVGRPEGPFFSTAASGIGLYCQLDAGYRPVRFAMGNIAFALGVGRGVMGGFRTLARGEVKEYSSMYNEIRFHALERLKHEAARCGANSVVDVKIEMLPYGPGTVELLLTGTASHHPALSQGGVAPHQVVTSELTGEELWNLARIGYVPLQIVMATSVYSLGVAAGIGAMFQGLRRTELPEVTQLIYQARENCLELVRREAQQLGAERVMSTRLQIREIGQGLVEIVAIGTAVRRALPGMEPQSQQLIPQALIL